MPHTLFSRDKHQPHKSDFFITLGLVAVVAFFGGTGFLSYWNTRTINENMALVAHTHDVITTLENLMSLMKDAETGQRGYVITGDERYLEPYSLAISRIGGRIADLEELTRDNPTQQARIPEIKKHSSIKLNELKETIEARRSKGFEITRALVMTDRGKTSMDAFREQIQLMQDHERDLRKTRMEETDAAYQLALVSGIATGLLGMLLSGIVGYLVRRSNFQRRHQEWLQSGEVGLSQAIFGEQRMEQLSDNVLAFLSKYLGAHAGAMYVSENGRYQRKAGYGLVSNDNLPESFDIGEGLLGQAAKDHRSIAISNVPDGYLRVSSALGQSTPQHLVIAPAASDGHTNAVLEFAFLHAIPPHAVELLEQIAESLGAAIKSSHYREHLQNLLEETQRQAEELQAQGEELRVNNEELEEQSRALKESQVRLEHQQTELEQTNAQLEEQTQQLETQRDELMRAQDDLHLRSRELEQASQYKSDFLANMSHELRTPLNSSLILAKLLADNDNGNLTEEQVRYAETIHDAGNDLLALINDILDLSKIEAGHMDIRPETVNIASLVSNLTRTFEPLARQKAISFETQLSPAIGQTVETDYKRLEQVLKNLLSNAIKFTDVGMVTLRIEKAGEDKLTFAVTDTGIGIPADKHDVIFEAFRQADGTTNRKYGGTGLGLSISRELARLLGGTIHLASEQGLGSTFSITIPLTYSATNVQPRPTLTTPSPRLEAAAPMHELAPMRPAIVSLHSFADDREQLTEHRRTILVVEDDEPFARILFDLAHELNFHCLVAATADEALQLVQRYKPHAVILDVNLPDHSGLSVLDRLKHNTRTRHIPVHVISAGDYAQNALSLGAVGYMLKPVKRDELIVALQSLETRLVHRMRRVLVVEDDPVQQHAMQKLLGTHDVETIGVGTAADCLARLKDETFDCMVLDLTLPDASGYFLLEKLSSEDAYSFPPVIVYTGRDLSADEEQRLRRYSKSIIIKGAKSPERLLDEVTLFLHQVVSELPPEQQRMLQKSQSRDAVLEGRRILVVEDDVRNVYALTSIFEPRGASVQIARNGKEALRMLDDAKSDAKKSIDLVLMDVMMPEMDGLTATREIRKQREWAKLPIIMLTAKAMQDDQENCIAAGANDYMAKPLDVEKLLSLVRVWMPR